LNSKELNQARQKVRESKYKKGVDELINLREKVEQSKCILVEKCTRCPSCVSAMPLICSKMNRQIIDKENIPKWCPLENFSDIEYAYRGNKR
jgi:hypothetical protein